MHPQQRKRVDEAPASCQRVLSAAYNGTASKREAIKAFCLTCTGFLRADVAACTAVTCALHSYRPFQRDDDEESPSATRAETA